MIEEYKKILLKDLCARLPYNVVIRCTDNDTDYKCFVTTDILNELLHNFEYYDYKPYLRPMSSMTKEEYESIKYDFLFYGDSILHTGELFTCGEAVDWLNAHHFDYHNLIEKGLALEAPEGMYKFD